MNQEPNGTNLELKGIVRMLEKTVELVQEAEMTGNLTGRSAAALRSYNATVRHLAGAGQIPTALFAPLPEDASLTDVGISSAQLAEYLRAGLPEAGQEEKMPIVNRGLTIGNLHLGGGAEKDEISEMVREYLADWLREARPGAAPAGAEGAAAGEGAAPASETAARASSEPAATAPRALPGQPARVEELRTEPPAKSRA